MDNSTKSKIVIPPAAGYLVYKMYKSGTFGKVKDFLFHHADEAVASKQSVFSSDMETSPNFNFNDIIEIGEADTIQGLPAENIVFDPSVYQFYDDTCAIQSQRLVLKQYGIDVSQEEMIEVAKEHGWYVEGYGTPNGMIGKLMEYYGVDVDGSYGNNIFNLSNELAQGHQIIVSVDAYELVYPELTEGLDELYGENPNHALVVVGIDTTDPDNVQVIVTDPGTGNRQMAYPAEQFIDAWKDSECFMVTTNDVPEEAPFYHYNPISEFAGIPMENLQRLSCMDIDTSMHDEYTNFVDDLLDNPTDFDNLLVQYGEIFVIDDSSDNYVTDAGI